MKFRVAVAVCAMAIVVSSCSTGSTAPDEMGLLYKGGEFSSQKFEQCIEPGSRDWSGPSDTYYMYPVGQRTFRFDASNNGADSSPISVVTNDPVEMTVTGVATFDFVRDCDKVKEFHEKIGLKYRRAHDGGNAWWIAVLNDYLKAPLDKAMDAAAKQADFRSLYGSPDAKRIWEEAVIALLPQFVEQQAGAPYFTNFRLNLQTPEPPKDVKDSFTRKQVAIEDNQAQKARNETIRTALDGLKIECTALGTEACMQKYAIDHGAQVIVTNGTGVNVGAK